MKFILNILKTKTFEHSIITVIGTGVNGVLGVLFFILLARNLSPAEFGMVSVSILVLTLVSDIADLGINTGLINFISKYAGIDNEKVQQFLKLGLKSKILLWLIVLIIGWLSAPIAATALFNKPELTEALKIALVGVGGAMLFSFVTNSLQALQEYKNWSLLNISMNSIRLLLSLVLISFMLMNQVNALVIYVLVPFLGFFIGLFFLPKNFLKAKNENSLAKDFFHFNKWIAVSIVISAFSSRIDTFFLTRMSSLSQVGIYSVASQLTSFLPQLTFAIAAVAAPKLGSFRNNKDAFLYLKKLQLYCLGIALACLVMIPAAFLLIPVFYGDIFRESVPIFIILFFSQMIFLLSLPSHQAIFYFFSNPKIFSLISLAHLFILAIFAFFLINIYGLFGAALAVLIGSIFNFLIPSIWVLKKFTQR